MIVMLMITNTPLLILFNVWSSFFNYYHLGKNLKMHTNAIVNKNIHTIFAEFFKIVSRPQGCDEDVLQ